MTRATTGVRPGWGKSTLITLAFWMLAVMMLLNVRGLHLWGSPVIMSYAVALACCLCLVVLVGARWWLAGGTSGVLLLAAVASYLVIGGTVAVADGSDAGKDLLRQTFFLLVIVASLLGGRSVLERVGTEALLKGMLVVLTASCLVVLASPILSGLGVLPGYRLPFRLTGTFTDPNDAGFIGCMTAALAMALLGGVRRRVPAYLGLTAGCGAVLGSFSVSAVFVLGVLFAFFLLFNGRERRGPIVRWLFASYLLGSFAYLTVNLTTITSHGEQQEKIDTVVAILSGEGMSGVRTNRPFLWEVALTKALESPIVGHGMGRLHSLPGGPISYRGKPEGVHNVYLMLVGEAGIVPLWLYCLFLFSLLRFYWITPNSLARPVIVGWAVVMALFGVTFHHWLTLGAYCFLAGLSCALAASQVEIRHRPAAARYPPRVAHSSH